MPTAESESVLGDLANVDYISALGEFGEDELIRRYRAGIGLSTDGAAYDGSSCAPPTRDLTARERDVLCGLITDIVGVAMRTNSARHVRGGSDWLNHLLAIRDVIDPRREEDDE